MLQIYSPPLKILKSLFLCVLTMKTPNLDNLKGELQGEELELLERLLQNEDLVHTAFVTIDKLGHGRLARSLEDYIRKGQPYTNFISQIFEYFCFLNLSRTSHCLTPKESFDIFRKIFSTSPQQTCPDGLSWTDDKTVWFNEYKTNHRRFTAVKQPGKYNSLFRYLSYSTARHIFEEALHEHGYNGVTDNLGLRLVIPQDDHAEFNLSGRFRYQFEIDNCPVTMTTVEVISNAFIRDYSPYFGLH